MSFRPALIPTVAMIVAAFITLNLSAWQYRRHLAQEARLAEVEARIHQAPVTAEGLTAAPEALKWRKAALIGTFDPDSRAYVAGRFLFGRPGYEVIETLDVQGGPKVLVDRGWIPAEDWQTHARAIDTQGPLTVEGLLLPIEPGERVTALPEDDTHPRRYPQETSAFLGVGTKRVGVPWATLADRGVKVAGFYLVVGPERARGQRPAPEPLPVSGYIAEPHVIGHLSYAGQWLLITMVMVAVWGWAAVLRGRRLNGTAA